MRRERRRQVAERAHHLVPGVHEALKTYRNARNDPDLAGLIALFGSTERIIHRFKRRGETMYGADSKIPLHPKAIGPWRSDSPLPKANPLSTLNAPPPTGFSRT